MSAVVIVDTSVLLNVLDVPAFNQDRTAILEEFYDLVDADASFLLPMAAIFETGNHIARLADGGQRRRYAAKFCQEIGKALDGGAPWRPIQFPDSGRFAAWLDGFPDHAMRGQSMVDLSIIKEWEATCARHPGLRVRIWSLDGALQGYDRAP